jgi:hypothetical protein
MQTQQKAASDQQAQALEARKASQEAQYQKGKLLLEAQKQQAQSQFRQVEMLGMRERAAEGLA